MSNIEFEFVRRMENEMGIKSLPEKGSKLAAGYDFYYNDYNRVMIEPKEIKYIDTGIKAYFPASMVLLLFNRSSNPKKKNLVLVNGVGVVDADYADNEENDGEIAFAFMNIGDEPIVIGQGDKLGQGVFVEYFDVGDYNNSSVDERTGGFGSSDREFRKEVVDNE